MDLGIPQHYFRAFCHLQESRSFFYDETLHSILCHRCSGIYSGFFIFTILFMLLKWNGFWKNSTSKTFSYIMAALSILLSAFQVQLESFMGIFILTDGPARFIIGCIAGLGLIQMVLMMQNNTAKTKLSSKWVLILCCLLLSSHFFLSKTLYLYLAITSLSGLVLLYLAMNYFVLKSFLPKLSLPLTTLIVVLLVISEWIALFFYNTKHHV